MSKQGICYIAGAGPGDLGLVTLKAKQCIAEADVIVYDALINKKMLKWAREDAEKIYVGKRCKVHRATQDEINEMLVKFTSEGKNVLRLKGGDPMVFGRGGEEAACLAEAGLRFEIVPGISSVIAGPAYAGIPVTHRDHCSQVTIFTGHQQGEDGADSIDYEQLAKTPGAVIFVMGIKRIEEISQRLVEEGAAADTPIALIRWATTGRQTTLIATLATVADEVEKQGFKAPAVAVVGEVVNEREKLQWFETQRPLLGKKVVVTRTRSQAGKLSDTLENLGADVIELPTIRIEHPDDREEFVEGVANVHTYDWLVFSSPNGVERFFDAFFSVYDDARSIGGVRIAAVGPSTAAKIKEYRIGVDLMPESEFVAEGLVKAFAEKEHIENQTVLWVRAQDARDTIFEGLNGLGAIVDKCLAYKTVPETNDPSGGRERFENEGADLITFTSASTAENFNALGLPLPEGCKIASIGPVTSEAIRATGKTPDAEAKQHTIDGLTEAIVELLG